MPAMIEGFPGFPSRRAKRTPQSMESSSTMDNRRRFPRTSRMRPLDVLVGVLLVLEGPWTAGPLAGTWPLLPVAAWDQWDRADHPANHPQWPSANSGPGDFSFDSPSLWDNLIGGAVAPSWRADAPAVTPEPPLTTAATPGHSALACNFSDWRPVAAPWPDRLQESWDRVDAVAPGQTTQPPKPFRPSQPLVERPARAPVRIPAPPCYASIQLPRPAAAAPTATFQLLYSPDPLPSTAWDAKAETSTQSSAEVHTHTSVAVLATALPAAATFTLRVRVSSGASSTGPLLADTLQPPPGQQRPWGESWDQGKPGSSSWRPKPYPYPASNVDVEAVDLTHQHQAANCEVQQTTTTTTTHRPAGAAPPSTPPSTPTPPRDEDEDESPAPNGPSAAPSPEKPAQPQRPAAAAGNNKPSTSTARPASAPPAPALAAASGAATTTAATTSSRSPPPGPPPDKATGTTAKPVPSQGQSSVNKKP
ncbi:hypothetical protein FOCC_FOCC018022 [Frankliniella occidentalis]|nr:hypothetical protein FOCC_FOCC018022 [Frankliniella occidentalis]